MSDEKVTVVTPVGRLAFSRFLFTPETTDQGKEKYSCAILLDPSKNIDAIKKIIEDEAKAFFNGKVPVGMIMPVKKAPAKTIANFPYTEGMLILNVSTKFAISVIDRNNDEVLESGIKAGDNVRLAISAFAYDVKGKQGVGLNCNGVQLISEGEAFASRVNAADLFGESEMSEADLANFGLTSGGEGEASTDSGSEDPFGF